MASTQHLYVRNASAGSGKTFTLAAHYIALLLHGERFQSILAVTFTNKATAEMKERIVGYLYAIAHHLQEPATQGFLQRVRDIYHELGYNAELLTDEVCQRAAATIHADMLSHYDEMRVQTIDSFLQTLLGGMVQKLNGAVGYQVELDTKRVISDAVDKLLTEDAQDPKVCQMITRYMDEQLQEGKNWDVRKGLNEIGMELFKELLQEKEQQLVFDPVRLGQLKTALDWHHTAPLTKLKQALQQVRDWDFSAFSYGNEIENRINKYAQQIEGKIDDDNKAFEDFTSRSLAKLDNAQLLAIRDLAQQCRQAYLTYRYRTRYLNDLALMGVLLHRINETLAQTNSRLLATTANTLAQALMPGDADFILEKAGIRYRHIMLDEFQDTSRLQWVNFSKLLTEILSNQEGSTLIVGDLKQSIYRWRNGQWEIMANLPTDWADYYNTQTPPLVCNFRSEKEVVRFNLETMNYLASHEQHFQSLYDEGYDGTNLSNYYRKGHEGGYVQVQCYAQYGGTYAMDTQRMVRRNILYSIFATMERLLSKGVEPRKMMILFRNNDEAKELLDTLHSLPTTHYPLLSNTPFISSNCFQLQYSQWVNLLVCALRVIYTHDEVAGTYVQQFAPHIDIATLQTDLPSMALTDVVEQLIERIILAQKQDIDGLSYINCFRDYVRGYVQQQGSDGKAFLRYWEDTLCTKTIPAVDVQGIQMMTIHAAKGLEAANVFIPFLDWKMEEDHAGSKLWCEVSELRTDKGEPALLPIMQNKTTAEAGFADAYTREHQLQRVDNLNLLYVAFTRAAERLFIYADVAKPGDKLDVGQLLAQRCGLMEQVQALIKDKRIGGVEDYVIATYGDPEWMAPQEEKKKTTDPFSFQEAEVQSAHCVSSDTHITFRQSQESSKYGWDLPTIPDQQQELERNVIGTICHDILSHIGLYADVEAARKAVEKEVARTYNQGYIPSESLRAHILEQLLATVSYPAMVPWFTGKWHLQCEEAILLLNDHDEVEERRMDRVMWSLDRTEAIVLDYKFGHDDVKYDRQVHRYMDICRRMGATQVKGFLWIAEEQTLIEV